MISWHSAPTFGGYNFIEKITFHRLPVAPAPFLMPQLLPRDAGAALRAIVGGVLPAYWMPMSLSVLAWVLFELLERPRPREMINWNKNKN
jgi:hypothetical protein